MSYLLDTNILSELRRKAPNAGVVEWCSRRPASTFFLSVLTLGELRKGVESLASSDRRTALLDWLEVELPTFFSGRILPIDSQVADCWGRLMAAAGCPIPAIDSLIGATAVQHGLRLVTRNVRDFADLGLEVSIPGASEKGARADARAFRRPHQVLALRRPRRRVRVHCALHHGGSG